ncbi:MAG: hypothetical protein ACRDTF_16210 [Pseudonocardiaceae bacterium]
MAHSNSGRKALGWRRASSDSPPLGPGAPPVDRIRTFLYALVDLVAAQTDLLLVAEWSSPTARYRSGPYRVHHFHLTMLIAEASLGADAKYLADALLALLFWVRAARTAAATSRQTTESHTRPLRDTRTDHRSGRDPD